jgi:Bacterial mobilisation protein (MobC)
MARYERTYTGERRTEHVGFYVTPSERAELEDAAKGQGAPTLSGYARELLFRRSAAVVAATRRNPEAKAIMDALTAAAYELSAIGNNLNQIARALNTTGELRDWQQDELREAIRLFEKGEAQHIAAVERVLDL